MDGCCDEGDTVEFRMPLRGGPSQLLCPSVKNVYNKFSVRFFLRLVFFVKVRYVMGQSTKADKDEDAPDDGHSSEEEQRQDLEDDDFQPIESYSEESEVTSNFIEIKLWR